MSKVSGMVDESLQEWLTGFNLHESLRHHVWDVLLTLPQAVRADLVEDPAFHLGDYEPGRAFQVRVNLPAARSVSRSVILKRSLRDRPPEFVRWVIAHELAHAHLRNAGRYPGEDPENAADALAAEWGHPRPQDWRRLFR